MKDLNSENKYVCNYCKKHVDFIWSSGIYNSNPNARICYICKQKMIDNAYKNLISWKISFMKTVGLILIYFA